MPNSEKIENAAQTLASQFRSNQLHLLAPDQLPDDLDEAYLVQRAYQM